MEAVQPSSQPPNNLTPDNETTTEVVSVELSLPQKRKRSIEESDDDNIGEGRNKRTKSTNHSIDSNSNGDISQQQETAPNGNHINQMDQPEGLQFEEAGGHDEWQATIDELMESQTDQPPKYPTISCLNYQAASAESLTPATESLHNDFFVLLSKWKVRALATEPEIYEKGLHEHIHSELLGFGRIDSDEALQLLQNGLLEIAVGFHTTAVLLIDWIRISDFAECIQLYNTCIDKGIDSEFIGLIKYCFAFKVKTRTPNSMGGVNVDILPNVLHDICKNQVYDCHYLSEIIIRTVLGAKDFNVSEEVSSLPNTFLSSNVSAYERQVFFWHMCTTLIAYFNKPCVSVGEMLLKCDRHFSGGSNNFVHLTVFNGTSLQKVVIHKSVVLRINEDCFDPISTDTIVANPEDVDMFLTFLYFRNYPLKLLGFASLGLYKLLKALNIKNIWKIFAEDGLDFKSYKGSNRIELLILAIKLGWRDKGSQFHDAALNWKKIIPLQSMDLLVSSLSKNEMHAFVMYRFTAFDNELEKYYMLLKWSFHQANCTWDIWCRPEFYLTVKYQFDQVRSALNYGDMIKFKSVVEGQRYFTYDRGSFFF